MQETRDATYEALLATLPEDEIIDLDERAAIMEYDGGLPRREAERQAAYLYLRDHL